MGTLQVTVGSGGAPHHDEPASSEQGTAHPQHGCPNPPQPTWGQGSSTGTRRRPSGWLWTPPKNMQHQDGCVAGWCGRRQFSCGCRALHLPTPSAHIPPLHSVTPTALWRLIRAIAAVVVVVADKVLGNALAVPAHELPLVTRVVVYCNEAPLSAPAPHTPCSPRGRPCCSLSPRQWG